MDAWEKAGLPRFSERIGFEASVEGGRYIYWFTDDPALPADQVRRWIDIEIDDQTEIDLVRDAVRRGSPYIEFVGELME